MKRRNSASGAHSAEERNSREIPELFHALTQPVTTLCCGLAVSAQRARGKELRRDLATAREQAERVAKLVSVLRERVEERLGKSEIPTLQGASFAGQDFPTSSPAAKTGNNLPL